MPTKRRSPKRNKEQKLKKVIFSRRKIFSGYANDLTFVNAYRKILTYSESYALFVRKVIYALQVFKYTIL